MADCGSRSDRCRHRGRSRPTSVLRNPSAESRWPIRRRSPAIVNDTRHDLDAATPSMRLRCPGCRTSPRRRASSLALGHNDRAIEVLHDHITSPAAIDARRVAHAARSLSRGPASVRNSASSPTDFHAHFNVQAPLWEAFATTTAPRRRDRRLSRTCEQQVVELWRKPGCRAYLERLLYDNREGRRNGFPLSTYADILLLLQVLDAPPAVDIDGDLGRRRQARRSHGATRATTAAPSRAQADAARACGFAPGAAAHPFRDRAAGHRKHARSRRRPRPRTIVRRDSAHEHAFFEAGSRGAPSRPPSDRASP